MIRIRLSILVRSKDMRVICMMKSMLLKTLFKKSKETLCPSGLQIYLVKSVCTLDIKTDLFMKNVS